MRPCFKPIALLLAILILHGCGGPVYFSGDDVSILEIDEAIKEDRLEETLGSPDAELQTDQYQIKAYEIYRGTEAFVIPGTIIPIPYDSDIWYLTLAYSSDGAYLGRRTWYGAESTAEATEKHLSALQEAIEMHVDHLAHVSRLRKNCEVSFADAEQLSDEVTFERFGQCSHSSEVNRKSAIMWACLVAHQRHSYAQQYVGRYFEYEHQETAVSRYALEAYKWYKLVDDSGVGTGIPLDRVASKMTSSEILEAKQMVIDWQPNPSECEAISRAEAGATQPD